MNKICNLLMGFVLCLFVFASFVPSDSVYAAEAIDIDKDVSLTLQYNHNSVPLEGACFSIYKVANVDKYGGYTVAEDFSSYPVEFEGLDQKGWEKLAETLSGYAQADNLRPVDTGNTNSLGKLSFPSTDSVNMKPGLYLLIGKNLTSDGYIYICQPSIIAVPMLSQSNTWDYNIVIYPKNERQENYNTYRRVIVVWNDKGYEDIRPKNVVVDLINDGIMYDGQVLSKKCNWCYEWKNLDNHCSFSVLEEGAERYTVEITQEGNTFIVTNTYIDQKEEQQEKIPQTGQLWWPVPTFLAAGIALFLIGYVINKRKKDEE